MISSQRGCDIEATSADDGGGVDEQVDEARPYGMSLINREICMINCNKQCENFFKEIKSIHFKALISYWMMVGSYRVRSVKAAYEQGLVSLIDLIHKEKILRFSDDDTEMIEFAGSPTNSNCRHRGFCLDTENLGFVDLVYYQLGEIGKVVLSEDEMLSLGRRCAKLQPGSLYYGFPEEIDNWLNKYYAVFNPKPDSLKPLLQNVKNPSVLLLRGVDELSLQSDCFPLDRLRYLTALEISGSSRLLTIPENTISQLSELRCLNLSDLPIEALPSSFFSNLGMLTWLVLRGCCKLMTLDLNSIELSLEVLVLSHCTALQNLVCSEWCRRNLSFLDLSYTPLDPLQLLSYYQLSPDFLFTGQVNHIIQVIDLSGCSGFTKLDACLVNKMPYLQKLDLSWTNLKHLPSLAELTCLLQLSLRGLELDSFETLASLPNQVELDLMGLKIDSSQEFKVDFLQSLESLQLLKSLTNLCGKTTRHV